MRIWLDLPDAFVEELAGKGEDLSRSVLEALASDAYRQYSFAQFEREERNQCRTVAHAPRESSGRVRS